MSDVNDRGITVTEIAAMDQPIDVATETTAAFVGRALRGPLDTPVLITNFAAFGRRFGGIWQRSSLGPAVKQFFEHGGKQLYIVRISNSAGGAMICLPAHGGVLVLRAVEPGSTERIRAAVDYDRLPDDETHRFNLTIQRMSPETGLVADQEIFTGLTCEEGERNFVGDALLTSTLVRMQAPLPTGRPLRTSEGYSEPVQPGTDGGSLTDYDLVGSATRGTGMFALNEVDRIDVVYLSPPGLDRVPGPAAIIAAERYCKKRGAMLIIDPPAHWKEVDDAIEGIRESGYASANIMTYFPRIISVKNLRGRPRAAGGAIAGMLCKLDRQYGPWQSLDECGVTFSRRICPVFDIQDEDASQLIREGFNVIASGPRAPATLCGSVTLSRDAELDREFFRLPVRRLCLAMTSTIEQATRWAVFELDANKAANQLHSQVHAYLCSLADTGAIADDRFTVHCDVHFKKSATDAESAVHVMLAFRPVGAKESLSLSLHQTAAEFRVATTAFAPASSEVA